MSGLIDHPKLQLAKRAVDRTSERISRARWLFMPAGICAIIFMGVHAAADAIDDRLLWMLDQIDSVADRVWSIWDFTHPLVNWIQAEERVVIARSATLLWELVVDVILVIPSIGYTEEAVSHSRRRRWVPLDSRAWPALVRRVWARPTLIRLMLPITVGFIAVAGACSLARAVQAVVYLNLRDMLPSGIAGAVGRIMAVIVLVAAVASMGWRACLRTLQHADQVSQVLPTMSSRKRRIPLWSTLVTLPFGMVALIDASFVFSFFR